MISRLTPHFIDLTYEAALKSFWRKKALRKFLVRSGVSEGLVATWHTEEESKREFLDRCFEKLPNTEEGGEAILQMAAYLIDQTTFPDLDDWEDSAEKIADAKRAILNLKNYVDEQKKDVEDRQRQAKARQHFQKLQEDVKRSQRSIEDLSCRLKTLSTQLGTQKAGYDFQDWFYDLMDYCEIVSRRPYTHNGRQIDGSITVGDTTYLIELKFTSNQAGATDIDTFHKKVTSKADNTMGILVSISGYSSTAVQEASGDKTPLLLLDHTHIYYVLGGIMNFRDIIERVRRHASQTGDSYIKPTEFGN